MSNNNITCTDIINQLQGMRSILRDNPSLNGLWLYVGNIRLEVALVITPEFMDDYYWYIYEDFDYDVHLHGEWKDIWNHFAPVIEVQS